MFTSFSINLHNKTAGAIDEIPHFNSEKVAAVISLVSCLRSDSGSCSYAGVRIGPHFPVGFPYVEACALPGRLRKPFMQNQAPGYFSFTMFSRSVLENHQSAFVAIADIAGVRVVLNAVIHRTAAD